MTASQGTLNILIVDDEINIRKTLSYCLETEGHTVIAVANSQEALQEGKGGPLISLSLISGLKEKTAWILSLRYSSNHPG